MILELFRGTKYTPASSTPTFRTPFDVFEDFHFDTRTMMIYPQKWITDHVEYSISLRWGSNEGTAIIYRDAALVEGALLRVRSDRLN
jgi:hypothetical protein